MQTESIKQEASRLLDNLPDKATWDDLMYQIGLDHRFGHSEPRLLGSGEVPVAYARASSDWNFGRNDYQGQKNHQRSRSK